MPKKPKKAFSPKSQRQPRTAPQNSPESIINEYPRWRTSFIDHGGPWGFDRNIDGAALELIIEKLKNFETMTWGQIEGKENHSIPVTRICKEAKKRLEEIKKDDYQDLFSFRLMGKIRLWGIKQIDACYLLWWDPNHTVCPSIQKHT